jgi:hypothetical protein
MEAYANAGTLNGSAGNSAPVMGGRRRKSLRKVSAKAIRKTLRKLGMKPKGRVVLKGGADPVAPPPAPAAEAPKGGRRRRSARRKSGLRRMFGL